jgi:hypothetical protein
MPYTGMYTHTVRDSHGLVLGNLNLFAKAKTKLQNRIKFVGCQADHCQSHDNGSCALSQIIIVAFRIFHGATQGALATTWHPQNGKLRLPWT